MTDQTPAVEALSGPPRRPVTIPTFAQPVPADPPGPPEPPAMGTTGPRPLTDRLTRSEHISPFRPDRPAENTPGVPGIRTDTSDFPGKPTVAETAKLIGGLIGLAAFGAALIVQYARRRTLRKPTAEQTASMAKPLAKIGLRHVDPGIINADLVDALAAATAFGDYLTDGPLTTAGVRTDPGVPPNLQGDPQQ